MKVGRVRIVWQVVMHAQFMDRHGEDTHFHFTLITFIVYLPV